MKRITLTLSNTLAINIIYIWQSIIYLKGRYGGELYLEEYLGSGAMPQTPKLFIHLI